MQPGGAQRQQQQERIEAQMNDNLKDARTKQKVQYDKRHEKVQWRVGDIVIKKTTRQNEGDRRALQPKYDGKFEIIEVKEGERLRLRRVENPGVVIDAVANQVRPFKAREELVEVPAESDEYEVQQILCEAQLKGGLSRAVRGLPGQEGLVVATRV